jgi:hypothetical protein
MTSKTGPISRAIYLDVVIVPSYRFKFLKAAEGRSDAPLNATCCGPSGRTFRQS